MTNLDQYKGTFPWVDEIISENEALREEKETLKIALFRLQVRLVENQNVLKQDIEKAGHIIEQALAKYQGQEKAGSGE